ncbi:MAG: AMP-binding protein [Actinomycetota bacterium]|nr:AMP-binding protein [Actinomycetota bacterium]
MNAPFATDGITVGADGIKRYDGLAPNLVYALEGTVDRAPDEVALVEAGGERVTYGELLSRAGRVAGGLRDRGVGQGDRVAVRMVNGNDWVFAFWGTLLAGGVVVPVNTRFTDEEAAYVVEDSGAMLTLVDGAPLPDGDPLDAADSARHDAGPDDLAAIFYTSGTTGFPKGAMTTHANFASNVETCIRCLGTDRTRHHTTLISVPLFHVTGCNSQLLLMTVLGGTSVIMPAFDVGQFLGLIESERITYLITVPAIYWLALNHPDFAGVDTSSVEVIAYGGAPISPDLVHQIRDAFPSARVGNGFGLTETSSVATFLPHEDAAEHADSVGYPAPVVDVRIAEPDPASGVGELEIRGPNVVAGYWNKPHQTADTFVHGWLRTGDMGRIDDGGRVHVVDRKKDMINRGGENVYSVEVENALVRHPDVAEVAVIGVPDEVMGEKVGAVIVPRGAELDVEAVLASAGELLADFKVPQYVVVRHEALPRNPGGKLLKPALRSETVWGEPLR